MTTSFEQLLNVYWLRPETALWRELDIRAMHQFKFTSPSLDLGCGDGMFSFIRAGGAVSNQFDAFRSVANLDKFFENVEVYDAYEKNEQSIVVEPPGYQIDVAFDHKENLLKRACSLIYIANPKLAMLIGRSRFQTKALILFFRILFIGLMIRNQF